MSNDLTDDDLTPVETPAKRDPKIRPHDALIRAVERGVQGVAFHDYLNGSPQFRFPCLVPGCRERIYVVVTHDTEREAAPELVRLVLTDARQDHAKEHARALIADVLRENVPGSTVEVIDPEPPDIVRAGKGNAVREGHPGRILVTVPCEIDDCTEVYRHTWTTVNAIQDLENVADIANHVNEAIDAHRVSHRAIAHDGSADRDALTPS